MSAECNKHGTDLVYPDGSWPVGVCPSCEADRYRKLLREVRDIAAREWHAEETNYEWYGDIAGMIGQELGLTPDTPLLDV